MISAYIIGWGCGNDTFTNGNVKASEGPDDTGPVFSTFSTYGMKYNKTAHYLHGGDKAIKKNCDWLNFTKNNVCHNPLTWKIHDNELIDKSKHLGLIDTMNK